MRLSHYTKEPIRRKFFTLDDITELTHCLKIANRSRLATSKDVAQLLEEEFYNLQAVPVELLIHDGTFERTQWVNVTRDLQYIIDATGDRFNHISFAVYRRNVTPWVYRKALNSEIYFSSHHMPSSVPEGLSSDFTDVELISRTSSPFAKELRAIILPVS